MLKSLLSGLFDLVFPNNCILCKRHLKTPPAQGPLCLSCHGLIEFNKPPFCPKCSRHLNREGQDLLCSECRRARYHFDRAWAVTFYNDTMKRLIHQFKYGNKTALRFTFAQLILSFVDTYRIGLNDFDLVVPVPLHPARFRERGYNQAYLLATALEKAWDMNLSRSAVTRSRHTTNQAMLPEKERWTNIQGAFKIMASHKIDGKSILIIDDLMTTGATISEIALCLKNAGAQKVTALTLAIAS